MASTIPDYRDLTIDHLIATEAELLARTADLERDVRTLREILAAALDVLHRVLRERVRYRARCQRLAAELRRRRPGRQDAA